MTHDVVIENLNNSAEPIFARIYRRNAGWFFLTFQFRRQHKNYIQS